MDDCCQEHAGNASQCVEGLGGIEALDARLFAPHTVDIGVTRRLEERQSAGHNEVGHEEGVEGADGPGREEEQCPRSIEPESDDDAPFE